MKLWLTLFCFLLSYFVEAQAISTIAGNGSAINSGDGGTAIVAGINYPALCSFDVFGNFFITTGIYGNSVRKINTLGVISTIAGVTGSSGYSGDSSLATSARLNGPQGIAEDSIGNIYISDALNNRIRKVDISTGIITTIAGTGIAGYGGDNGLANNALLNDPNGICFDKFGNLYIADYMNSRVRKINNLGIITTVAGTGINGYNGDGGLADTSEIRGVLSICTDDTGNLYLADEANGRIRKVDLSGTIHTVAGDGVPAYSGDGGLAISAEVTPHMITCDNFGNIYMTDIYADKVRIIYTSGIINLFAGNGISGFSGDGGKADTCEFHNIGGVSTDTCGNLYVCDIDNKRVRKVTYPLCHNLGLDVKKVSTALKDITIYPNPVHEVLHIDNIKTPTKYGIVNIYGIIEQRGTLQEGSNSIDVRELSSGVYVLTLSNIPPDPLQRGNAIPERIKIVKE